MAKPKRVSIAERNRAAISRSDAEPEPKPPVTDEPAQAEQPQPAPAGERGRSARRAAPSQATKRSSVYLTQAELRAARSAYLVDFDTRDGSADSFLRWSADAIAEFAGLTVEARQAVRQELGPSAEETRKAQQVQFPSDVADAVAVAMRADRIAGHGDRSRNIFFGYALRWQSIQALKRSGLDQLPEPPERLPLLFPR